MRHLINIVLILLLPFQVLSLDSINSKLLDHAKSIKASETDLNKIVDQLCTITKTEAEKAEIFFYWISQNIDYDVEAFLSGSYKFNKTDVLITKKGVCQHYSELFQEMCSLVNITCFIVDGYAKGFNDNPREPFDFTKANHAWNVIKLKEEYYFVDATWSSGHVNYVNYVTRELKYFRKINISNVITKSTSFRETHLPSDPAWQLNDTIVSTKSFARYRDYENMVKDPLDIITTT